MRMTFEGFSWTMPSLAAAMTAALVLVPGMASAQEGQQAPGATEQGAPGSAAQTSRGTDRFVRLYDLNRDGKVSIDEIKTDQARMFTAIDIDDDGKLSVDDIRRRGRSLQIFRTTTLFDLLDVNGDGTLSVAEIQGPSERWFKRYDENGDGVMEDNEIPPQRHWGRGGRR
jgi:hypothetical protein